MDKKYIIANWKMNPQTWAEAEGILDTMSDYFSTTRQDLFDQVLPGVVICPPFVFLEEVGKVLQISSLGNKAELGAQDVSTDDSGAMTGEVSGPMLRKLGVKYVIIGHSERRWKLGESDEIVNKKIKATLRNEMVPIVCIGEIKRDDNFKEFLKEQVKATFDGLSVYEIGKCFIAYEPVWAISSNPGAMPDTIESATESIEIIKNTLIENWQMEIENLPKALYGGSVNSNNVAEFLKQKEIDGVLVGGASVDKDEFVKILSVV